MQDRTSANSMKVLLQRTAGPYIRVNLDIFGRGDAPIHVRYASNSDQGGESQRNVAMCQSRPDAPQQSK
jgi:hypothetical protein